MKKVKKILSLATASLVMGGLIFSTPINTKTASADILRNPLNNKYYYAPQEKITGNYQERVSFKFRHRHFPHRYKYYSSSLFYVGGDGYLKLKTYAPIRDRSYIFDDSYVMFVLDKDLNVRFKWLSNLNPKSSDQEELDYLAQEVNKLKIGLGNLIIIIPRYWKETVVFDTKGPTSALKTTGYNNWNIGYTDNEHKYNTLLRVTNDGLQEANFHWGDERVFIHP